MSYLPITVSAANNHPDHHEHYRAEYTHPRLLAQMMR